MIVPGGSTSVSTYFALRLSATGLEAPGLVVTTFNLQYVRSGALPSTVATATALAAVNSAWAANAAKEIDGTNQPGLYRIDWPDAAFAVGVREVILSLKCATAFTEHLRVELQTGNALLDLPDGVETGLTVRQGFRLMAAALAGKASGMGTATGIFRNPGDTKNRITATIDASGNRTAITTDLT
jgi:hypothetical protein